MKGKNFSEIIHLIVREDSRYDASAYNFIRQGLDFTLSKIQKEAVNRPTHHITGQELCHGLKDFALEQYGPMALTLLNEWGIYRTEDFGELVFNLVEYEIFGKTEKDSPDDFKSVYDFGSTFKKPFEPSARNHIFQNQEDR